MIEVDQIRKSYNSTRALDGFTLKVERGDLFGLVGPNGAGKTTLIKTLATLLAPDGGAARIGGIDVTGDPRAVKRLVGYMPDQPGLYQDMRVREFLEFFADAFGLKGETRHAAIELALSRSGLQERSDSFVESLSFGMKQRLVVAKTLLHGPSVLLLDEPATGLDPIARIALRKDLQALNAEGATILISSHILGDLEDICTQVALIAQGRNVSDGEGHQVIRLRQPRAPARLCEIEFLGGTAAVLAIVTGAEGVRVLEVGTKRLLVEVAGGEEQVAALLRALVSGGVAVVRFDNRAAGLEDRYQRAFGGPQ